MKENKEISFEVWDDDNWNEESGVLSFDNIDEAIAVTSLVTRVAPEEIKEFWNTRTLDAIGINGWVIEKIEN